MLACLQYKHPSEALYNLCAHTHFSFHTAKEHKKKQQSHTYINIRPGHRPYVVTTKESDVPPSPSVKGESLAHGTPNMSCITQKSGSQSSSRASQKQRNGLSPETPERQRDDGKAGKLGEREMPRRKEKAESLECLSGNHETLGLSLQREKESTANSASPQASEEGEGGEGGGHYDSLSPESPSSARQRPLVVHNYENFPFNPTRERRHSVTGRTEEGVVTTPPQRSRTGSDVSSASSAPPLPERHYSESDINDGFFPGLPDLSLPSPSPAPQEQASNSEEVDTLSPLHSTHSSRSHEVRRELSEQGNEYAIINPAWKKNVKGRSPSLTRVNDDDVVPVDKDGSKAPPLLSDGPATVLDQSGHGSMDLDSDLVNQKRAELEISSRFTQSVKYAEVQIGSQKPPVLVNSSDGTYDKIIDSKLEVKGE